MQVSLNFLLKLASDGDKLANEVVRIIFEASIQGMHASAYMSTGGNTYTVRFFPPIPIPNNKKS